MPLRPRCQIVRANCTLLIVWVVLLLVDQQLQISISAETLQIPSHHRYSIEATRLLPGYDEWYGKQRNKDGWLDDNGSDNKKKEEKDTHDNGKDEKYGNKWKDENENSKREPDTYKVTKQEDSPVDDDKGSTSTKEDDTMGKHSSLEIGDAVSTNNDDNNDDKTEPHGCTSYLSPQRAVSRNEYTDFLLEAALIDIFNKKDNENSIVDLASLKNIFLDSDGDFIEDPPIPDYTLLPHSVLRTFSTYACKYPPRKDADIEEFCESQRDSNAVDYGMLESAVIRLASIDDEIEMNSVVEDLCHEASNAWEEIIWNILVFYQEAQNSSVAPENGSSQKPTFSPTKISLTDAPTRLEVDSPESMRSKYLEECESYLAPQRLVTRKEYTDYLLRAAILEALQHADNRSLDVNRLKSLIFDSDGEFNDNALIPTYALLPNSILRKFASYACKYPPRDNDEIESFCASSSNSVVYAMLDGASIRLASIDDSDMVQSIVQDLCDEAAVNWKELVQRVMIFYLEQQTGFPTSSPTLTPTPGPRTSPTTRPSPKPTMSPTFRSTSSPTDSRITTSKKTTIHLSPLILRLGINISDTAGLYHSKKEKKVLTKHTESYLASWYESKLQLHMSNVSTKVNLTMAENDVLLRRRLATPATKRRRLELIGHIGFVGKVKFRHATKNDWTPPTKSELLALTLSAFDDVSWRRKFIDDLVRSQGERGGLLSYISNVSISAHNSSEQSQGTDEGNGNAQGLLSNTLDVIIVVLLIATFVLGLCFICLKLKLRGSSRNSLKKSKKAIPHDSFSCKEKKCIRRAVSEDASSSTKREKQIVRNANASHKERERNEADSPPVPEVIFQASSLAASRSTVKDEGRKVTREKSALSVCSLTDHDPAVESSVGAGNNDASVVTAIGCKGDDTSNFRSFEHVWNAFDDDDDSTRSCEISDGVKDGCPDDVSDVFSDAWMKEVAALHGDGADV